MTTEAKHEMKEEVASKSLTTWSYFYGVEAHKLKGSVLIPYNKRMGHLSGIWKSMDAEARVAWLEKNPVAKGVTLIVPKAKSGSVPATTTKTVSSTTEVAKASAGTASGPAKPP